MLIMHTMLLMNSCQYNMKICISYEYILYFHNKIAICALGECKYAHVCFSLPWQREVWNYFSLKY